MPREYDERSSEELDRLVEGYECQRCGRVPTQRELENGFCPTVGCRERKEKAKKP